MLSRAERTARNIEVAVGLGIVLGALCVIAMLVIAGVDVVRWLLR
jgi:hypothetical protein